MTISDHISFHKLVASQGKLLAIDVGTKRIGIAMSDGSRVLATPTTIISREGNNKDFAKIKQIIDDNAVVALVVGFPINMDSTFNEMSEFTKKFIANLDEFLGGKLHIFIADERLTSFEARQIALSIKKRRNQKYYDDIAACVILKDFMDLVAINHL